MRSQACQSYFIVDKGRGTEWKRKERSTLLAGRACLFYNSGSLVESQKKKMKISEKNP